MRGKFITFEGIDSAARAATSPACRAPLNGRGLQVVATVSRAARRSAKIARDPAQRSVHLETEALLMFAARREHLAAVIELALGRGEWVDADRFTDATYAYQGAGAGWTGTKFGGELEHWVHGHLQRT